MLPHPMCLYDTIAVFVARPKNIGTYFSPRASLLGHG